MPQKNHYKQRYSQREYIVDDGNQCGPPIQCSPPSECDSLLSIHFANNSFMRKVRHIRGKMNFPLYIEMHSEISLCIVRV